MVQEEKKDPLERRVSLFVEVNVTAAELAATERIVEVLLLALTQVL